eukprot:4127543-Pyramimonas_sp.AAC.1
MNIENFHHHPGGELEWERKCILWCNAVAKKYCDGELTQAEAKQMKVDYMAKRGDTGSAGEMEKPMMKAAG